MATKYSVTPVGKLVYPYLIEPDTEFDANGVYHTDLELSIPDGEEIVNAIVEAQAKLSEDTQARDPKKRIPKAGPMPYSINQEDMTIKFRFKLKATGKRKDGVEFSQKPVLKAPDGSDLNLRPSNGSLAKVAYEIVPFYNPALGCGVQLRLRGVKVTQLVEYSKGGDNMFGSDNEEVDNSEMGDF